MEIELGSRIKEIRLSCRENQFVFARHFDKTQATISRWETGLQRPSHRDLVKLASLGNTSMGWLFTGNESPIYEISAFEVSVFTYAELEDPHIVIENFSANDPSDRVLCPTDLYSPTTLALRIKGDVMRPFREGSLLFFSRNQEGVDDNSLKRLCVVKRSDTDEILVRELLESHREGRYTLASWFSDPILEVPIEWAAPISSIKPV